MDGWMDGWMDGTTKHLGHTSRALAGGKSITISLAYEEEYGRAYGSLLFPAVLPASPVSSRAPQLPSYNATKQSRLSLFFLLVLFTTRASTYS
jgi:hypothetical protein